MQNSQRYPHTLLLAVTVLLASSGAQAYTPADDDIRLRVPPSLMLDQEPPSISPSITPAPGADTLPDFTNNITQYEGLRICFYELEVDVRNCHHAFENNVQGYNECVTMAGEAYSGCLSWVQKLPIEESQN